jgi:hypothetical protein
VAAETVITAGGGLLWRLTDRLGLRLDYTFEDREGSYTKHGFGSSVLVEF